MAAKPQLTDANNASIAPKLKSSNALLNPNETKYIPINPVTKYVTCFFNIQSLKTSTAIRLMKIGVDPLIKPARLDEIVSSALANR